MSGRPPAGTAGRWLMIAAGVVVLATLAAALLVMDSPARQRAERLDAIRVTDLQRLSDRIDAHADVHDELPERLAVVAGAPGRTIADPATGQSYHYEVTGDRSYRLCATFETAPDEQRDVVIGRDEWRHGEGRQCFDRKVDRDARAATPALAD